jgi:NADP-dependent aldehyde dehydrogenase
MNPSTKEALPDQYPISGMNEIEQVLQAGRQAIIELRSIPVENIARFLELFADKIEARREELIELAWLETGYPKEPRLRSVELPRTTNQLRQGAAAVRERSWSMPTIDTKNNIRSMYRPLAGPVVVFGPNNFPFAFNSLAGGDFVAAIAAGNPVIGKANTSHPGTTRLFGELAFEAVRESELPRAMVQLLYRTDRESGLKLVSHPLVGATGFTGSRHAGLQLKEAADRAGKPIYLEMSSINPVFILPGALEERLEEVASEFGTSCLSGTGQFCTNPGLVIVLENARSEALLKQVSQHFQTTPSGVLLGEGSPGQLGEAVTTLQQNGAELVVGGKVAEAKGYSFENTLLRVKGAQFLSSPAALQTEAFGNVSLFVFAKDEAEMLQIADALEGNLTGSIYTDRNGTDDKLYARLEPVLRPKVGRLLNDKMPTGVAVSPAMMHGGPYPATGHAGFTAVGIPASLRRFAMLESYDNVRPSRLPLELRDENPTGKTWRLIDGAWSQVSL